MRVPLLRGWVARHRTKPRTCAKSWPPASLTSPSSTPEPACTSASSLAHRRVASTIACLSAASTASCPLSPPRRCAAALACFAARGRYAVVCLLSRTGVASPASASASASSASTASPAPSSSGMAGARRCARRSSAATASRTRPRAHIRRRLSLRRSGGAGRDRNDARDGAVDGGAAAEGAGSDAPPPRRTARIARRGGGGRGPGGGARGQGGVTRRASAPLLLEVRVPCHAPRHHGADEQRGDSHNQKDVAEVLAEAVEGVARLHAVVQ